MNAREYFEGIRDEVRAVEREAARLARLAREESSHLRLRYHPESGGHGGGSSDPMGRVDARLDDERNLRRRRASLNAEIDEACAVLYGRDGRRGVSMVKGSYYADIVCMYYLQGLPWPAVASEKGFTVAWCKELATSAFACIDAFGFAALKGD